MEHECGILSISSKDILHKNTFIEHLKKLEHRGREAFGIGYITFRKSYHQNEVIYNTITIDKYPYRVSEYDFAIHKDKNIGNNVIGHVRYSTTKSKKNGGNIQPLLGNHPILGNFVLVHNGNIPKGVETISSQMENKSDTYILLEFIENCNEKNYESILLKMLNTIKNVYCISILDEMGTLYACRDTTGIRPLVIGKSNTGICIGSETCCFPKEYKYCREVVNGEVITIKNGEIINSKVSPYKRSFCSFEHIYFLHTESIVGGIQVKKIRLILGKILAQKEKKNNQNYNTDAIVVGSPNSGITLGQGFANFLQLEYSQLIWKETGCGRSFILPDQDSRVKLLNKYVHFNRDKIKNKIIYLLDDSIVRGNTTKNMVMKLREFGAKEVHIRIGSPPIKHPCFFGIDIPDRQLLVAVGKTNEEIKNSIGCDSLVYLNIEDVHKAVGDNNMCNGCFTGKYPGQQRTGFPEGSLDW